MAINNNKTPVPVKNQTVPSLTIILTLIVTAVATFFLLTSVYLTANTGELHTVPQSDVIKQYVTITNNQWDHYNKSSTFTYDDELDSHTSEHNGTFIFAPNGTGLDHQSSMPHRRVKRGVISLASMIKCITGCNPWNYKDYGCYCGFQGDGYPVDGIDRCCYMHDMCYSRTSCHQALVYFVSYKWICQGYNRAKCGYVFGGSSKSQCAFQLCECDRRFAKCLSKYRCPRTKPSCDKHIYYGK